MEQALRAHLLAAAGMSALVGTRVDWGLRPQAANGLPAVALHEISAPRTYTMQGRDGLVDALVQIDVWATTFKATRDVATAVRAALDNVSTRTPLRAAFIEGSRTTNEATDTGVLYRTSLDVRVWATEAT